MARYQLKLAYDGTEFAGFQRQAAQKGRTVQGEVEEALRQLGWQGRSISGAGRTDSGVHASGQVIAFDLEWRHSPESLRAALNAKLPRDVAVQSAQVASPDFQPRYQAAGRRYHYRIFCQDGRDPLRERYAWRVWPAVDIGRMHSAARLLEGTHDFAAFGAPTRAGGSTVRRVLSAAWQPAAFLPDGRTGGWRFEIVANAFLYHMVRRLVFVSVAIGQGAMEIETLLSALEQSSQVPRQGLAPPQGLILVEVLYPASEETGSLASMHGKVDDSGEDQRGKNVLS